jgi:hypothetical protein
MVTEKRSEAEAGKGFSRRQFLKVAGAGAAAVGASSGLAAIGGQSLLSPEVAHAATHPQNFGRMFPSLPSFAQATDAVRATLMDIGKPGGVLDANDDLAAGPVALIVDPALSANNRNNPTHTAGTTFMGQFLDHDMTFDTSSALGVPTEPGKSPNARTPTLDLDSVYGRGPVADSQLYDPADRIKLRVESGGLFEDLPRGSDMRAIIADPRNDENVVIAGLQAAFLLFHNRMVDLVRRTIPSARDPFKTARTLTTYHYHWLILKEFLPLFVGQPMVDRILSEGRRFYTVKKDEAFIPVEFQGATYRFGHSMVRPSYRANLKGDNGGPFFAMIFDPAGDGQADPVDLRGGARAPRRFIGWQTFFNFGDGEVKPNKRIDTKISTPLFHLPLSALAFPGGPLALPQRNLLRHLTWQLPSGQAIARAMGVTPLAAADFEELRGYGLGFETSTPLWYYVLKEAEVVEDGLHLGPVGGRIVGEVFIGLLQSDPKSFLNAQPDFKPIVPTRTGRPEDFRMVDFLTFAGVDPSSRGQ